MKSVGMETSAIQNEGDTRQSFLTQNENENRITSPRLNFSNVTKNNRNKTFTDAMDASTVHAISENPRAISEGRIEISFKKFHYSLPTLAADYEEKARLRYRLPEYTLTNDRPLLGNKKFIYRSIYGRPRYRRCRAITFPQVESRNSNRPTNRHIFKKTTSLNKERVGTLRARINSLNREIKKESRLRCKNINKDYVVEAGAIKELTPDSNCWRNEEPTYLQEEQMDAPLEVKRFKNVSLPKQRRPIERFRKIVRLICFLLKTKSSTNGKYKEPQHSVVFEQLEELSDSGISSDDGMAFDPKYFKAIREIKLSPEAVQILSMTPGTRTEEQIQAALVGLKAAVGAFCEYPLKMQKRLVNVGWYESFEAKRVIIRQGHRAENYYFILSGTALVTILVNDPVTGEERSTTIAVLEKGSSFGELALLHHNTRSATVLCKNEVALLAVGREDFRDIFMSYEDGKEPDHIQFLRTIPYLKDLPLEQCITRHDVCIFHYFRRGVVIVKNSNTEWIYIIKSGSCRVLTNLAKRRTSIGSNRGSKNIFSLPVIPVNEAERRKLLYTACGERSTRTAWTTSIKRPRTEPQTRKEKADLSLPAITAENNKFKKTVKKVNFALPWLERFKPKDVQEQVNAHRQRIVSLHKEMTNVSLALNKNVNLNTDKNTEKGEHVCVQIELIKPKDQFGLASILYDWNAVKCHLVSNGAECILLKKSWFLQNTTEDARRELRAQIPPYPTQETLTQNLQDQADWETFKTQTITDLLDTLHL